ncbi:Sua5/YciO/YrdC/YwlC family protein [Lewinella sp. 4G2]|uniref:Sua5/YciO/YrdC/YwlC family protein n=1 Tax=Lewinella sp. 4G2 TaxID=1803372 RepID=UPI0018D42DFD|nr:Sua5/YciO/YrdC/YwlC family protein [Lewinella sp. 4G2]
MQHPFPAFGAGTLSVLEQQGLVLLPTANLWQLIAHGGKRSAIERLLQVCPPSPTNRPELIFADTALLRAWCPGIDPALETLLHYHKRPLTVSVPAGKRVPVSLLDERGEVAVRLAFDSACYRICEDLEFPLVACLAASSSQAGLPTRFGKIQSDVLQAAQHVVRRRLNEEIGQQPAVTVRMNERSELEFLRS